MSKYIPEDIDFVERILRELPSNIMFKDTECRYVFCTHYWRHIKIGDDPNWTIRGKTDLEVRKDTENARMAYEQDKRILATGKGHLCLSECAARHEVSEGRRSGCARAGAYDLRGLLHGSACRRSFPK